MSNRRGDPTAKEASSKRVSKKRPNEWNSSTLMNEWSIDSPPHWWMNDQPPDQTTKIRQQTNDRQMLDFHIRIDKQPELKSHLPPATCHLPHPTSQFPSANFLVSFFSLRVLFKLTISKLPKAILQSCNTYCNTCCTSCCVILDVPCSRASKSVALRIVISSSYSRKDI